MALLLFVIYLFLSCLVLAKNTDKVAWEVLSAVYLLIGTFVVGMSFLPGLVVWLAIFAIVAFSRVEPLRLWFSNIIYKVAQKTIPKLSQTEEEALNAGDTWLEQDIFRGSPDWDRLSNVHTELTDEEKAFLEGETKVLCDMLDDWEVTQARDLPEKAWAFIREKGFLGLVIEKEYGGKGFSARAHSDIVMKIASRCGAAAVTVMVPNSLGPGELLHYYGTDEQKKYFLPRLANGTDIPCFALTEPGAGSDATSIKSEAIVVEKTINNQKVLGLDITLNKRWITLAPVATLIGLAVNVKDPQGLLGDEGEEGITCVMIDRDTKNLEIGNRHLPAGQGFMNGTIRGKNLFVPIDRIIGGQKMAGNGWQMLVNCLSIGRSISLPALGAATSSVAYVTSGAFSHVRRQFNTEIGTFEGIEEKLAEIAGMNYMVNATRLLTIAAVQDHKKPSVASAITKYFNTEFGRTTVNAAMDVHAGRAVVIGPRNYVTSLYHSVPISITVEGANIMTRNLLIFGQGSMACHPFVREEFYAISQENKARFHHLLWEHVHYFMKNMAKTFLSVWSGGHFTPSRSNPLKRCYQRVNRLSYAFSWLADLSLMVLGGDLKRKERLSARLADSMSYLYIAMASLRLYEKNGEQGDYQDHAQWAVDYCSYHAQKSMLAFCRNFPIRPLGWLMRLWAFPFGQTMRYPSDVLDRKLAKTMASNNAYRDWLKTCIHLCGNTDENVDRMESAFQQVLGAGDLYHKIKDLKRFKFGELKQQLVERVAAGDVTQEEMDAIIAVERARWDAIQVDEFFFEDCKKGNLQSQTDKVPNPLDH